MNSDLDQIIRDMSVRSTNPIGLMDASSFYVGMKKIAEDGQPDTTGMVEGPFLVPLPQAVELIAQMVSNEFKTQVYYIFYANMLRGLSHEGIAEEFMEHARDELDHATYLLRRMSVLSPGGITIPPYPPPEPLSDPTEIVKTMIVVEQMGLTLWKQLHSIMGDNPMKYSIEEYLQTEEEHQDELWQLVESVQSPQMPTAETMAEPSGPKTAATIFEAALQRKMAKDLTPAARANVGTKNFVFPDQRKYPIHDKDHALAALGMVAMHGTDDEKSKVRSAVDARYPGLNVKKASHARIQNWVALARTQADDIHKKDQKRTELSDQKPKSLVDLVLRSKVSFGTDEAADSYIANEQQLSAQQAMAEAAHAKTIMMQASQAAQQAQAEADAAQAQLQQAQAQVEQLGQQVAQESQQAMMATQQAAEAEGRAADHSISKMQLGMRVNQLRQELANMVMQDPVAESAATVSDLAAQGMPATPMQQQQAEQQQAAAANGEAPSAETQEQQGEAERAQADAQEQTAEADQAEAKDKDKGGKPGTHVTVKTAETIGTVVQRAGSKRGPVGAAAAPAATGLKALVEKARPFAPHIAAGAAGVGLLGGGLALANHARNISKDKTAGVVDNVGRAAGKSMAEGVSEAVTAGAKKHAPLLAGGALAAAGLGAVHGSAKRQQRKSDMTDAVAEGIRRTKQASPADRRMAKAILGGEKDELGSSLINIIRKRMPGIAGDHAQAAQKAVADAAAAANPDKATQTLHGLGDRIRPHLPGAAVGGGLGLLLGRASKSQSPNQPYYGQ